MVREVVREIDETSAANLYIAVSELVTNAVVHGPDDDVTVHVERAAARVRIEVGDSGTAEFALPNGTSADSVGNHGLAIVEAFTDRCGIEHRPQTLVWCELDLPR